LIRWSGDHQAIKLGPVHRHRQSQLAIRAPRGSVARMSRLRGAARGRPPAARFRL